MTAVLYQKEGPIVSITLNRPETRNRIDAEIFTGLSRALVGFRDDPGALVAVVTASGEAFSDGANHFLLFGIPEAVGIFCKKSDLFSATPILGGGQGKGFVIDCIRSS